ncbi:hypothetical protein BC835DRAFT_1550884 [Cytidiella melzeri]|nr:hypothetical protein BC835DRAFT_1550884 [Cytidiella melzeri]
MQDSSYILVVSSHMHIASLVNQVSKCRSVVRALAEECAYLCCRFWLRVLVSLIASAEDALTSIFEWESRILSAPACGVYTPQQSAIVIVGGEAGLGQAISLSLSEHGYTVFALCSNVPATCSSSEQTTKSSDVSSLLYAWHKRKERSTHTSWGLVAPISCDTKSGAQRTHAFETVHAYCVKHSLNLVALVVLSPSSPAKREEYRHRLSKPAAHLELRNVYPSTDWNSIDGLSWIEPILVIEDYIDMLSEASGRVVLLSHGQRECYLCRPVSLLHGVGQQIAENLGHLLRNVGIRVAFISVGPVGRSHEQEPHEACSRRTMQSTADPSCSRLHIAISDLLGSYAVECGSFCEDLRKIITTRYPRYHYSMGIHPFFDSIRFTTPDILRQLLMRAFR